MAWWDFSGPTPADIVRGILEREAAAGVSAPQVALAPGSLASASTDSRSDVDIIRAILARERAASAVVPDPPAVDPRVEPEHVDAGGAGSMVAAVDDCDAAVDVCGGAAEAPEAASGEDTDAEDWAFGIDDAEAHSLEVEARGLASGSSLGAAPATCSPRLR
jgi:hypothetical protein